MLPLLALLASCGPKAQECIDHASCPDGQACVAEVCTPVECLSSADCALREFCDPGYACKDGCEVDADCMAGETCDGQNHTCAAYGCRDTQLDCYYNEFCDPRSGQCQLSDGAHCKPCSGFGNDCPTGADCWSFSDADGNPQGSYCLVQCTTDDECPRGYSCYDVSGQGHIRCGGSCPLYDEFGYLPW